MNRLQGKVALITGAARGLGLAIAKRFIEEGASVVVLNDLDNEAVEKAAAPLGAVGLAADVSSSAAVKRIKLRHILVALPDKPTETQIAEAKRKATELMEKVRAGADFARLAADTSDDEQTKFSGGELGWTERGSIDTEWEVIVFAMNKGEVRGPITGPRGLHVFQVTEVERNQQKPFAQMKEQLRNEIFRKEMERQTKLWLDELREKAHIQMKL